MKKCPKSKKRVCIKKGRGRRTARCFCARKRR